MFSKEKMVEFNRSAKIAKKEGVPSLKYTRLDSSSLCMKIYADAAFASNDDLSSQLGHLILLTDETGKACWNTQVRSRNV